MKACTAQNAKWRFQMGNQTRYVTLKAENKIVGVYYDYKDFFTGDCKESYSKYLCLSPDEGQIAYFKMEIFNTDRCSFQFYDGPYKGSWINYNGDYLYVTSKYDYLAGVFDNGETPGTVKLWTNQDGKKYWFKRGSNYKNDKCGESYYYIVTTSNESEALTFTINDIAPGLLEPRDSAALKEAAEKDPTK
jgi:hypothetical protein